MAILAFRFGTPYTRYENECQLIYHIEGLQTFLKLIMLEIQGLIAKVSQSWRGTIPESPDLEFKKWVIF